MNPQKVDKVLNFLTLTKPTNVQAFDLVKQVRSTAPVLTCPDSRPYQLYTDTSNEGIGTVSIQEETGNKNLINTYLDYRQVFDRGKTNSTNWNALRILRETKFSYVMVNATSPIRINYCHVGSRCSTLESLASSHSSPRQARVSRWPCTKLLVSLPDTLTYLRLWLPVLSTSPDSLSALTDRRNCH